MFKASFDHISCFGNTDSVDIKSQDSKQQVMEENITVSLCGEQILKALQKIYESVFFALKINL